MAEYIEREAVLNLIPEYRNLTQSDRAEHDRGWNNCRGEVIKRIKETPNAESVTAVVRCKSCRHSVWSKKHNMYCCKLHRWVMNKVRDRDFCSYGRPKKDGG
jgi:hypothetical protein